MVDGYVDGFDPTFVNLQTALLACLTRIATIEKTLVGNSLSPRQRENLQKELRLKQEEAKKLRTKMQARMY